MFLFDPLCCKLRPGLFKRVHIGRSLRPRTANPQKHFNNVTKVWPAKLRVIRAEDERCQQQRHISFVSNSWRRHRFPLSGGSGDKLHVWRGVCVLVSQLETTDLQPPVSGNLDFPQDLSGSSKPGTEGRCSRLCCFLRR